VVVVVGLVTQVAAVLVVYYLHRLHYRQVLHTQLPLALVGQGQQLIRLPEQMVQIQSFLGWLRQLVAAAVEVMVVHFLTVQQEVLVAVDQGITEVR
jgi:hypothetical protein